MLLASTEHCMKTALSPPPGAVKRLPVGVKVYLMLLLLLLLVVFGFGQQKGIVPFNKVAFDHEGGASFGKVIEMVLI